MAEVGGNVKLWSILAMVMWLGGFHINFIVGILCLVHLPSPWAITILVIWVTLMFLPAEYDTPVGSKVARFIVTHAKKLLPNQGDF
jgi:2-acylglycerol O-acyltransferase 2